MILGVRYNEGSRVAPGAFTLLWTVRCRTGVYYAAAFAPAIQVMARVATKQ
jgi:hypothetical protein